MENADGIGTVTPALVEARARELALIKGCDSSERRGARAPQTLRFGRDQFDCADEVDEFAEPILVECGTSTVFRQNAFQTRVVSLNRDHRVIDDLSDRRLLSAVLEIAPSRRWRDPENVFGLVLVRIFEMSASVFTFACDELRMLFFETIRNIFQEN